MEIEIEIEILETLIVTPSPSPLASPEPITLPLSHLDNDPNLRVTVRTLRLYSSSPNSSTVDDEPFHVIARSLAGALFHYYPLAGSLHLLSDSRLAVRCSAGQLGVPLTRAISPNTLESLIDLEPGSPGLDRLAPDLASGDALAHPLALQVTRFACGGFALGMCVHHAMCDGAGATKFLSAVAGFARGVEVAAVEPVWNRLSWLGPRNPPRVELDFGHVLGSSSTGPYDLHGGRSDDVIQECFHVNPVRLERFRGMLTEESGSSFTAFEALGAFIWRARVKATGIPNDEEVKFVYSMNIRNLLKPMLPIGYWGNGCVPVYVKLTVKELLQQPIWETAKLIKNSKNSMTDEYVRSYIDFQELHDKEGITAGRNASGFTDWRHLGHSEVDFGWGSPAAVRPLSWRLLGSLEPSFFLPYSSSDGRKKDGFKVLVCLPAFAMASFRTEMEMFSCEGSVQGNNMSSQL